MADMNTADPARLEDFAAAYARDPDGKHAAIAAGYAPSVAASTGMRLLRRPEVGAALAVHRQGHFDRVEEMGERLLAAAMVPAFADMRGLLDADGGLKPEGEIDGSLREGFRFYDPRKPLCQRRLLRVRRQGKLAALKFLGKYLRLFDAPAGDEGGPDAARGGFGRRARFAAEYTVDFNGCKAAVRAGYPAGNAANEASLLLKLPAIQGAVGAHARRRFARLGLTPERVLVEIGRVALASPRSWLDDDSRCRPLAEIDDDTLAALDWIDFGGDGRTVLKIRPLDRLAALELLARHYGLIDRYR